MLAKKFFTIFFVGASTICVAASKEAESAASDKNVKTKAAAVPLAASDINDQALSIIKNPGAPKGYSNKPKKDAVALVELLDKMPTADQISVLTTFFKTTQPYDWDAPDQLQIFFSVNYSQLSKLLNEYVQEPWDDFIKEVKKNVSDDDFFSWHAFYQLMKKYKLTPEGLLYAGKGWSALHSPGVLKFANDPAAPGKAAGFNQAYYQDAHNYYKFHIMPKIDEMIPTLAALAADLSSGNSLLSPYIYKMKFVRSSKLMSQKLRYGQQRPFIVLYAKRGKDSAQKALDGLYQLFKDSGINGSAIMPRFSAPVTSLIYVTQGDSDSKFPGQSVGDYFEPGTDDGKGRVYFKDSEAKGYLLRSPVTGQLIKNNYTPD